MNVDVLALLAHEQQEESEPDVFDHTFMHKVVFDAWLYRAGLINAQERREYIENTQPCDRELVLCELDLIKSCGRKDSNE